MTEYECRIQTHTYDASVSFNHNHFRDKCEKVAACREDFGRHHAQPNSPDVQANVRTVHGAPVPACALANMFKRQTPLIRISSGCHLTAEAVDVLLFLWSGKMN